MSGAEHSGLSVNAGLADALADAARNAGAASPRVRGADWRQAIVATVLPGGLIETTDGITARCLESYAGPAAGDRIIVSISSAGSWIAAGRLAGGGWMDYTPVWRSENGAAPSVGNGEIHGAWSPIGPGTVAFRIYLLWGSSTSGGGPNANWTLSLPVAPVGTAWKLAGRIVDAVAHNESANRFFRGTGLLSTDNGGVVRTLRDTHGSTGSAVGAVWDSDSGAPMQTASGTNEAWAAGDSLSLWGTYETAT